MDAELRDAIQNFLPGDLITNVASVSGGDINLAVRITTSRERYFVKWHRSPPHNFFEREAAGLMTLRESGAVRVPDVIGQGITRNSHTAFLILEWVEQGKKDQVAADSLGRDLAALHLTPQTRYGLGIDNFIGKLPQSNSLSDSWVIFYRDQRLRAQRDLAARHGLLPLKRAQQIDILMERLDEFIVDRECKPSLLHGDLWGGNWLADSTGQPYLIDPAVYIGEREADLAMTALFGGFPDSFYRAYDEVYPLASGYADRQPLYQLYYLLCHLNLFGESYGSNIDRILKRYVG